MVVSPIIFFVIVLSFEIEKVIEFVISELNLFNEFFAQYKNKNLVHMQRLLTCLSYLKTFHYLPRTKKKHSTKKRKRNNANRKQKREHKRRQTVKKWIERERREVKAIYVFLGQEGWG